jgi:O-antigen biosynthesis protein WbqP
MYKFFFKRLIDIVASFLCILIFSPLFIILASIIYFQDFGTPLFKQKRVGLNEQEFIVFKFRSMPLNTANVVSSNVSEIKITPFGKFIRRFNLDELPQLFNILNGDMSLIGPRPSLMSQGILIELRRENKVYSSSPGLTGLAQVNAFDNMPDEKKAYWDGLYANNITFINDVKIILRTLIYLTKKPPTY